MKLRLIDDWQTELHRLRCSRFSLACGVFTGVAAVLCAFTDAFNPWFLLGLPVFVDLALKKEAKPKKKGALR